MSETSRRDALIAAMAILVFRHTAEAASASRVFVHWLDPRNQRSSLDAQGLYCALDRPPVPVGFFGKEYQDALAWLLDPSSAGFELRPDLRHALLAKVVSRERE